MSRFGLIKHIVVLSTSFLIMLILFGLCPVVHAEIPEIIDIDLELSKAYADDEIRFFYDWPLDKKAEYSSTWKPRVDSYLLNHPDYPKESFLYYSTRCVYGLPNETHMHQKEAREIARKTLLDLGVSEETMDHRRIHLYFDITTSDIQYWKFTFATTGMTRTTGDTFDAKRFRVVINAVTGAVTRAFEINDVDMVNEFY